MICFPLLCLVLHFVISTPSTPRLQPFLNRFCNFLQVKTTKTTSEANLIHFGSYSTEIPFSLHKANDLVKEEVYNLTHLGFANKRDINLKFEDLSSNDTPLEELLARYLLPETHKYLEVHEQSQEVSGSADGDAEEESENEGK